MDHGNWEIGCNAGNLDELLSGEHAAMTLWFLAGYLKGMSDSRTLQDPALDPQAPQPGQRQR